MAKINKFLSKYSRCYENEYSKFIVRGDPVLGSHCFFVPGAGAGLSSFRSFSIFSCSFS